MLHCEVLQMPHSIGCGYGWCGIPGISVSVCCIVKCCNCHILLAVDMAGVAYQGLVCLCVAL